jgi:hypothetical protein
MALTIRKVSKEELPKTNVPGRQRQPSEFDPLMEEAYQDKEWREVVYDGTVETLNTLLSELNRAAVHFGYGKSVRGAIEKDEETGEVEEPVRNKDGEAVFFFQIRDKLKTGRRGPRNVEDGEETDETETEGVEIGASDLDPIAESIEDAKSNKRGRRNREEASV